MSWFKSGKGLLGSLLNGVQEGVSRPGHGTRVDGQTPLAGRLGYDSGLIHGLIQIQWFSSWVICWFDLIFSEAAWVMSWPECIPEELKVLESYLSWIDYFAGEVTWVASWLKHYFNIMNCDSYELTWKSHLSTNKANPISGVRPTHIFILGRFRFVCFRLSHGLIRIISSEDR